MTKIVASGKTIEEAENNGLAQLNVNKNRVKITVLEQATKGFLGFGSREAKVELELLPDSKEEAEKFIVRVAEAMGLHIKTEWLETKDGLELSISCDGDLGLLIGRRGQTLDALQYLTSIVANRYSDEHIRIVLDAENFRDRRKQTLEELADRLAAKVVRTRKEVVLEPMSPLERKIIHSKLQGSTKVRTFSKGDEPNRRIVIALR